MNFDWKIDYVNFPGERFSRVLYTTSPALRPEVLSNHGHKLKLIQKFLLTSVANVYSRKSYAYEMDFFFFICPYNDFRFRNNNQFQKFRLNTIQNITKSSFRNITLNIYLKKNLNIFRYYQKKIKVLIMFYLNIPIFLFYFNKLFW